MESSPLVLTLTSCIFYHLPIANPQTLSFTFKHLNRQTLLQKEVRPVKRDDQWYANLSLKITCASEDIKILMSVVALEQREMEEVGQCEIDLELLKRSQYQLFKLDHPTIVKVYTANRRNKLTLPTINRDNQTQEFIRQRQMFLRSLISPPKDVQLPKTPYFSKADEDLSEKRGMQFKIKSLINKTKGIQQPLIDMTRVASPKKLQRMAVKQEWEQDEEEQIRERTKTVYHEHYHYHLGQNMVSPIKKLQKAYDYQTVPCLTNDSESVSSYGQIRGRTMFNVKSPFKRS